MTKEELIWLAEQVQDGAKAEILAEFKRIAGLAGIKGRQGGGITDTTMHGAMCRGWRDVARLVLDPSVWSQRLQDRFLDAANRKVDA